MHIQGQRQGPRPSGSGGGTRVGKASCARPCFSDPACGFPLSAVDDDDLALDFGKKKKKKSSKVKEDGETAADGGEAGDAAAAPAAEDEDELSLDLALGKKKKKKKAKAREVDEFGGLDGEGGGKGEGQRSSGGLPWEGSDRDYTYEELLGEWVAWVGGWVRGVAVCGCIRRGVRSSVGRKKFSDTRGGCCWPAGLVREAIAAQTAPNSPAGPLGSLLQLFMHLNLTRHTAPTAPLRWRPAEPLRCHLTLLPPPPHHADRVFNILKAHNPELTGERRRTTLKPPQVAREGTKKTVFTNFMELCKSMNRNHEHVLVRVGWLVGGRWWCAC